MILRSPAENENAVICFHMCSPRLVIPAHAGIQVCCAELAWIPAFAGMTEPRRAIRSHPQTGIFKGGHEEDEVKKFKNIKSPKPSWPSFAAYTVACLAGESPATGI